MNDVTAGIPLDWRAQLDPIVDWTQFEATQSLVQADREANPGRVYPPASEVFQALEMTSFSSVRAVILGQDPYPHRARLTAWRFRSDPARRRSLGPSPTSSSRSSATMVRAIGTDRSSRGHVKACSS